jgi:polyhydroxybutyrate depolymerase
MLTRRHPISLCLIAFGWLTGMTAAPCEAGLTVSLQLEHDGLTRQYDLYVPDSAPPGPLPLVLDLHGFSSNSRDQRRFFGWDEVAEAEDFVVAFPQGFGSQWGAHVDRAGQDDIGFLSKLVSEISSNHAIDPLRVYVAGFSQGGAMAQRLACETRGIFAAYAGFAAPQTVSNLAQCTGQLNAPILLIMAENDDIVPYNGGAIVDPLPLTLVSASDNFEHWRERNGCVGPVSRTSLGSVSYCDMDVACGDGAEVRFCTIQGSHPLSTHLLFLNVDDIAVAQAGWDFMSRFEKVESEPEFLINPGLTDAWYDPLTVGQGFFIVVWEEIQTVFLSWFTYDTERPPQDVLAQLGEPGHRWLTAQGPYDGNTAMLAVYNTAGGVFDAPEPMPQAGDPVGTITIEWADCESGLLTYDLDQPQVSGEIPISRIVSDNVPLCEAFQEQ